MRHHATARTGVGWCRGCGGVGVVLGVARHRRRCRCGGGSRRDNAFHREQHRNGQRIGRGDRNGCALASRRRTDRRWRDRCERRNGARRDAERSWSDRIWIRFGRGSRKRREPCHCCSANPWRRCRRCGGQRARRGHGCRRGIPPVRCGYGRRRRCQYGAHIVRQPDRRCSLCRRERLGKRCKLRRCRLGAARRGYGRRRCCRCGDRIVQQPDRRCCLGRREWLGARHNLCRSVLDVARRGHRSCSNY